MLTILFGMNKQLFQINKCVEGARLEATLKASGLDKAGVELGGMRHFYFRDHHDSDSGGTGMRPSAQSIGSQPWLKIMPLNFFGPKTNESPHP